MRRHHPPYAHAYPAPSTQKVPELLETPATKWPSHSWPKSWPPSPRFASAPNGVKNSSRSNIEASTSSIDIRRRGRYLIGMRASQLPNAFAGMVLFFAFAFAGCERNGGQTSPPRTAQGHYNTDCNVDTDCAVTNDPDGGCCSNCHCSEEAVGISRAEYQKHVDQCATMGACPCEPEKQCPRVEPASAFVPRCRSGTCVAEHR